VRVSTAVGVTRISLVRVHSAMWTRGGMCNCTVRRLANTAMLFVGAAERDRLRSNIMTAQNQHVPHRTELEGCRLMTTSVCVGIEEEPARIKCTVSGYAVLDSFVSAGHSRCLYNTIHY
jgi:hypothetical protein